MHKLLGLGTRLCVIMFLAFTLLGGKDGKPGKAKPTFIPTLMCGQLPLSIAHPFLYFQGKELDVESSY